MLVQRSNGLILPADYRPGRGVVVPPLPWMRAGSLLRPYLGLAQLSKRIVPSSGAFDPTAYGTVWHWSNPTSWAAIADGAACTTLTTQAGANSPTQALSGKRGVARDAILNGYKVAETDGSDDFWSVTATLNQPIHTFVVARYLGARSGNETLVDGDTPNTARWYWFDATTMRATRESDHLATTPTNWHIYEHLVSGTATKARIDQGLYLPDVLTGTTAAAGLFVGCRGNSEADLANAQYAEILVYSTAVSDGDADIIVDYLQAKYGL